MNDFSVDYESRLLKGNRLRAWLHSARFDWVRKQLADRGDSNLRIFELGCFNGMILDHIQPWVDSYVGVDANWEGGLDQAKAKYAGRADLEFEKVERPEQLGGFACKSFDVSACLETIEHVPPQLVDGYLEQLARLTRSAVLITVPNEIGPVFLAKYCGKKLAGYQGERYSFGEVLAATGGLTQKVERDQHKGFDYRRLISSMEQFFEIEKVAGLPAVGLPPFLSFGIGIRAKPLPQE